MRRIVPKSVVFIGAGPKQCSCPSADERGNAALARENTTFRVAGFAARSVDNSDRQSIGVRRRLVISTTRTGGSVRAKAVLVNELGEELARNFCRRSCAGD